MTGQLLDVTGISAHNAADDFFQTVTGISAHNAADDLFQTPWSKSNFSFC